MMGKNWEEGAGEGGGAGKVVMVLKGADGSPGSPKTVIVFDGEKFITKREVPIEALAPSR